MITFVFCIALFVLPMSQVSAGLEQLRTNRQLPCSQIETIFGPIPSFSCIADALHAGVAVESTQFPLLQTFIEEGNNFSNVNSTTERSVEGEDLSNPRRSGHFWVLVRNIALQKLFNHRLFLVES